MKIIQILKGKGMEFEHGSSGKELIITQYVIVYAIFSIFSHLPFLKKIPQGSQVHGGLVLQFHKGPQLSWEHNNGMLPYISSRFIFRDERLIKVSHADAFKT